MKQFLGVVLVLFILTGCAKEERPSYPHRATPEMQRAFNEAEGLYLRQDFDRAVEFFQRFLQGHPYTELTDQARYRLGGIHLARGENEAALQYYNQVISGVYSPLLTPQAQFKASLSLHRTGRQLDAIAQLKQIERDHVAPPLCARIDSLGLQASDQTEYVDERSSVRWALFLLDDYALLTNDRSEMEKSVKLVPEEEALSRVHAWIEDDHLQLNDIEALPLDEYRGKRSGGYAFYKYAKTLIAAHDHKRALEVLEAYAMTYPRHEYYSSARLLLGEARGRVGQMNVKVGLLLPLTGKYRVYGESVLHGVECAIGIYDPCVGPQGVQLVIRDSQGDPVVARRAVEELAREGVQVIIGPLTSKTVEEAARESQKRGIPMIALSQREGVANLGDLIFRNSVTPSSQVETLVDYAVAKRGMQRFFILYPRNRLGQEYEKLFSETVVRHGGVIVGSQSYFADQMDFAAQLRPLGRKRVDGLVEKEGLAYDALFIPDSPRVVAFMVPTLSLMGVENVQLLGNSRWNSPQLIRRAGKYVEGSIFVDAFVKTSTNGETLIFVDRYHQAYGFSPTLLEGLGYDSMRMVLASIQDGSSVRRETIRDAIGMLSDFPGVTGRITFNESRDAKRKLTLLTVSEGQIQEIQEE